MPHTSLELIMQTQDIRLGMVAEYHNHAVHVDSLDIEHHQAEITLMGTAKHITVDIDELEDNPQAHPDSISYY